MSITGEVLAQSPEPESRDKVLDNRDRTGIWKCWFLRRGETQGNRRKTSRRKDENQQQTQPTYDAESGNRTRATLVGGEYSPGEVLGYILGGYVPPGSPNLDPVLERICTQNDTPF